MGIPKNKHGLIFTARMNIIYHDKRQLFFSKCINWSSYFTLIFSSAAFVALGDLIPNLINKELLVGVFATTVAAINGAILAFGVVDKIKLHSIYKIQWMEILKECQHLEEDDEPSVKNIIGKVLDLSATEPPPKKKVLATSYEEAKQAMGLSEKNSFWKRLSFSQS